ncbi:MAG TPA: NF038129 family PEP-CTERM protein [Gemmataceae bacterium]|nr:NF038129 family PEP-CTERM protein [Gemmataceae bacterium]
MHTQRSLCTLFLPLLALLGLFSSGRTQAGPITYQVSVDTSQLSGQSGYLDFEFNPGGLGAAAATATVTSFSPAANLNPNDPNNSISGDVSGSLTGTLIFDNGTAYNDYFESFAYGNSIQFDVMLSGPALNSSGASPNVNFGSSFAFSLYASDTVTPLLTTDPNGSVLTINVNADATTSVEHSRRVRMTTCQLLRPALFRVPSPRLRRLFCLSSLCRPGWFIGGAASSDIPLKVIGIEDIKLRAISDQSANVCVESVR